MKVDEEEDDRLLDAAAALAADEEDAEGDAEDEREANFAVAEDFRGVSSHKED
jgi:hypothetical protein